VIAIAVTAHASIRIEAFRLPIAAVAAPAMPVPTADLCAYGVFAAELLQNDLIDIEHPCFLSYDCLGSRPSNIAKVQACSRLRAKGVSAKERPLYDITPAAQFS
jgi:hypothetical protein